MERTILIRNIRRELDASDEAFLSLCRKKWGIPAEEPLRLRIVRQAVDARKKRDICLMVHAEATLDARLAGRLLRDKRLDTEPVAAEPEEKFAFGSEPQNGRIVVVGLGPGRTARAGRGVVLERKRAQSGEQCCIRRRRRGNVFGRKTDYAHQGRQNRRGSETACRLRRAGGDRPPCKAAHRNRSSADRCPHDAGGDSIPRRRGPVFCQVGRGPDDGRNASLHCRFPKREERNDPLRGADPCDRTGRARYGSDAVPFGNRHGAESGSLHPIRGSARRNIA